MGLAGVVDPQKPGVVHIKRCLMTVGIPAGQPAGAGMHHNHKSEKQRHVVPVNVVTSRQTQFVCRPGGVPRGAVGGAGIGTQTGVGQFAQVGGAGNGPPATVPKQPNRL